MTNDNNIIPFKRKDIKQAAEIVATVFVQDGNIGLEIKDGGLLLTPQSALQLCLVLVSAMRVVMDMPETKE